MPRASDFDEVNIATIRKPSTRKQMMKLFRKPRDDRLPSSAAKGINNAYHSKNLSPLLW